MPLGNVTPYHPESYEVIVISNKAYCLADMERRPMTSLTTGLTFYFNGAAIRDGQTGEVIKL